MTEDWIKEILEGLEDKGLRRRLELYALSEAAEEKSRRPLNFSSNDYLNLSQNPEVIELASRFLREYGSGSGASRLMTGTLACHQRLEAGLSDFLGYSASLVFGSGYLANLGVLSVLAGRNDLVFADKLSHASLIDAAVLSRAKLYRFRHNDAQHLRDLLKQASSQRKPGVRCLVITESVFSMDGDLAPLKSLSEAAKQWDAMLLVDEAHALGVFGPSGRGLISECGIQNDAYVCTATLSKSLASYGGLAVCSEAMRELLVNRSRPFIYNTALSPSCVGAALASLSIIRSSEGISQELCVRAALFRKALKETGLNIMKSESQVVPVLIGDSFKALSFSRRLKEAGIIAVAIREPTVPKGTARVRFSVTLAHSEEDLMQAVSVIEAMAREEGVL